MDAQDPERMICLFGSRTTTGNEFIKALKRSGNQFSLIIYSRKREPGYHQLDLTESRTFRTLSKTSFHTKTTLVSYSPIWLFAGFLERVSAQNPQDLNTVNTVLACSSSSAETKAYSFNDFDKNLSKKLKLAEQSIFKICEQYSINCIVIRPTMIYGNSGSFSDNNVNKLRKLVDTALIIPMPKNSGLRQPIHASQLAGASLKIICKANELNPSSSRHKELLSLGGDEILSYSEMLRRVASLNHNGDTRKKINIFLVPKNIFFALALPTLFISQKTFEAICRICADLSGFEKAHKIQGCEPKDFPVSDIK